MAKVFWSWQSDRPGKTGRHFVRDALSSAIDALAKGDEVDEPNRDIHLDHDRKGVSGSPDLASTILEKIRASSAFVADVTNVGASENEAENGKRKSLMNPNVAIELGFALSTVGGGGLLMVMNEEYGGRDTLPFDLAHKAGPIFYRLAADASPEDIKTQKALLTATLKQALRDCFASLDAAPKKQAESALAIFSPELARILAHQIHALDRAVVNFGCSSAGQPLPPESRTVFRPRTPVLYPSAPEFRELEPSDASLLVEFYDGLNGVADLVAQFSTTEEVWDMNTWNVLMQSIQKTVEKGLAAVERFCPTRLYSQTVPVAGTFQVRAAHSLKSMRQTLDAHIARHTALANAAKDAREAATRSSNARRR